MYFCGFRNNYFCFIVVCCICKFFVVWVSFSVFDDNVDLYGLKLKNYIRCMVVNVIVNINENI